MKNELVKHEETVPATTSGSDLLAVIANAVIDPRMDVEKMQALLNMHMQITARDAEREFITALAELQAELKPITKGGMNQHTHTKYARLMDIDLQLKPLLAKYGFSFSFDEEKSDGNLTTFVAKLSHKGGHSEIKRRTMPTDKAATNREGKAVRTAVQDAGATTSYAIRYLIKMHLNIVEIDEDTDGNPTTKITEDQAKDLEVAIKDARLDRGRFLVFMGVGDVPEILERDLKKAMNAIDVKRRDGK